MAKPNEALRGRYTMLTNGSLVNDAGEAVPFAALAIVSYNGATDDTGAGIVSGAGVMKTLKSVATFDEAIRNLSH